MECTGELERNFDGFPETICTAYHTILAYVFGHRDDFVCAACSDLIADGADTDDADDDTEAVSA